MDPRPSGDDPRTRGDARGAAHDAPAPAAPVAPAAPAAPASPARRRFLKFLMSFSVVSTISMIAAPVVAFLIPPKTPSTGGGSRTSAGKLSELPANTGRVVAMGSKPVIVTNTEAGVAAFSAVCTHLGCIVDFDPTLRHIICPCHDGHFSAESGAVISGPPPRPLAAVATAIEGDDIFLVPGAG